MATSSIRLRTPRPARRLARRRPRLLPHAAAEVLHPQLGDLQHLGDEIALDLLEPRRNAAARLGDEVERAELERLEHAAVAASATRPRSPRVGRFAISQRRKAKPSMIGISRSSVITSGRCFITCLMPSSPLTAVATTLMSGRDSSIREIVTRLYAESSMTSARIDGAGRTSLLIHHVVLQVPQLELRGERDQRLASGRGAGSRRR